MTNIITKPNKRLGNRRSQDMADPCIQEATIAVISTNITNITQGISDIKEGQNKLVRKLDGNGGPGLITQTALNTKAVARAWYFIGAIILAIIGAGIKVLY